MPGDMRRFAESIAHALGLDALGELTAVEELAKTIRWADAARLRAYVVGVGVGFVVAGAPA